MKQYNNIEIFKEFKANQEIKLSTFEQKVLDGNYCNSYKDNANNIYAFALNGDLTEKDANELLDTLSVYSDTWYLGDEKEEYVFVE